MHWQLRFVEYLDLPLRSVAADRDLPRRIQVQVGSCFGNRPCQNDFRACANTARHARLAYAV